MLLVLLLFGIAARQYRGVGEIGATFNSRGNCLGSYSSAPRFDIHQDDEVAATVPEPSDPVWSYCHIFWNPEVINSIRSPWHDTLYHDLTKLDLHASTSYELAMLEPVPGGVIHQVHIYTDGSYYASTDIAA